MRAVLSCRGFFPLGIVPGVFMQHLAGILVFPQVQFFSEGVSQDHQPCVSPVVNLAFLFVPVRYLGLPVVHKGASA